MYASTDCASFFDPIMPGSNCQYLYQNVNDCCPDKICNTQLENRAKCQLRNVTLVAGQKVYDPKVWRVIKMSDANLPWQLEANHS